MKRMKRIEIFLIIDLIIVVKESYWQNFSGGPIPKGEWPQHFLDESTE